MEISTKNQLQLKEIIQSKQVREVENEIHLLGVQDHLR